MYVPILVSMASGSSLSCSAIDLDADGGKNSGFGSVKLSCKFKPLNKNFTLGCNSQALVYA